MKVKRYKQLLPIKTSGGIIHQELTDDEELKDDAEDISKKESVSSFNFREEKLLTPIEEIIAEEKLVQDGKTRIAMLSHGLLENPENNIHNLKHLRTFIEDDRNPVPILKTYAVLSLCEVFKDIVPEYKIRVLSEKEAKQQMKKDTKKMQHYEESLLKGYQKYFVLLEDCLRGRNSQERKRKVDTKSRPCYEDKTIALKCLCELLLHHPYFNFTANIVSLIAPFSNNRSSETSSLVCETFQKLFAEDQKGEISHLITRSIYNLINSRKYRVGAQVLRIFLALRINEVNFGGANLSGEKTRLSYKERKAQWSRTERKNDKKNAQFKRDMEELEANENSGKKVQLHTKILVMVFHIYIRVLKLRQSSDLLSAVLEGFSKFAHLINVDFFDDLLSELSELVDRNGLKATDSLYAIHTAMKVLSGPGAVLNIDARQFYVHLYRQLPGLSNVHSCNSPHTIQLTLECLHMMLVQRRKLVALPRLLAFIKRLAFVALHCEESLAAALLSQVARLLHLHPKTDILLDAEAEGSGPYDAELPDPDYVHADSTALWELHLLRRSSCSADVRRRATAALAQNAANNSASTLDCTISKDASLKMNNCIAKDYAEDALASLERAEVAAKTCINGTISKKVHRRQHLAREALKAYLEDLTATSTTSLTDSALEHVVFLPS